MKFKSGTHFSSKRHRLKVSTSSLRLEYRNWLIYINSLSNPLNPFETKFGFCYNIPNFQPTFLYNNQPTFQYPNQSNPINNILQQANDPTSFFFIFTQQNLIQKRDPSIPATQIANQQPSYRKTQPSSPCHSRVSIFVQGSLLDFLCVIILVPRMSLFKIGRLPSYFGWKLVLVLRWKPYPPFRI